MSDEEKEELASLYVLGELSAEQSARFEADLSTDPELQNLTRELSEAYAAVAFEAPLHLPPARLKVTTMAAFREEHSRRKVVYASFLPWAIAAALAVAATFLLKQSTELKNEVVALRSRDALSEMRMANLQAQVEAFAETRATIMWDENAQIGRVRFEKLPPQTDKDYQLWVIDPKKPQPINAGLMQVHNEPGAGQEFHPDQPVGKDSKFAISLEPKGGSKQASGPIIFVGE